ncbi:MAG TPA: FkbM family methyltransferase [Puia sp.]|nr:FkbM family methyltransferase [Puia sp.]
MQQWVPGNLPDEYTFFFKLYAKGGTARRVGRLNRLQYPVNGRQFDYMIRRESSDMDVFQQIIFGGEYKAIIDIAREHNLQLSTILDAGSNIGLTTLYLKAFFPQSTVICIEPSRNTHAILEENIRINDLSGVSTEMKGLWSKNCFLKEKKFRDGKEWSFSLEESTEESPGAIQAVTISELMNKYGLQTIDFLKIDIEGGEKNIFLDAPGPADWLGRVRMIAIEIHDEVNCRNQIERLLESFQFKLQYSGELTIGIAERV